MGQKKEPNVGTVPCPSCMTRYEYLTTGHLSSANYISGAPLDIESYREWAAKEHNIDSDDPIFGTNQIQKPQNYRKHAERLGLPK